jgi:hypothetical protein
MATAGSKERHSSSDDEGAIRQTKKSQINKTTGRHRHTHKNEIKKPKQTKNGQKKILIIFSFPSYYGLS